MSGNLQSQCNCYQNTNGISHRTGKKEFKFVWKYKRAWTLKKKKKKTLATEEQSWKNHSPWLQTILKATVIKTVWHWHNKTDNRTEQTAQK